MGGHVLRVSRVAHLPFNSDLLHGASGHDQRRRVGANQGTPFDVLRRRDARFRRQLLLARRHQARGFFNFKSPGADEVHHHHFVRHRHLPRHRLHADGVRLRHRHRRVRVLQLRQDQGEGGGRRRLGGGDRRRRGRRGRNCAPRRRREEGVTEAALVTRAARENRHGR